MDMSLELQAARLRLVQQMPYLAAALYALVPVETHGLETMAVDSMWRLYFDPVVFNCWSKEEVAGVLLHEVNHLLRKHADRSVGKDSERWGIAADAEVNDGLIPRNLASTIALPEDSILPGKFGWPDNRLAEEYYALAESGAAGTKTQQGHKPSRSSAGSGGSAPGTGNHDSTHAEPGATGTEAEQGHKPSRSDAGSSSSASGDSNRGSAHAEPDTTGAEAKQGLEHPRPGAGNCGSASDGQNRWWEAPQTGGNVPPSISPVSAELIRQHVAAQILGEAQQAGNVPGGLIRWAKDRLRPRTDWRKALGATVRGSIAAVAGAADYSYSKPSRRQGVVRQGSVLRPALRGVRPAVTVIVDTSASVSSGQLAVAVSEIDGILRASGTSDLTVIAADATVESARRHVQCLQQVYASLIGGGGTDMGKAIQQAARMKPTPDVILVITDGFTPWHVNPLRKIRVVALLLDGRKKCHNPPNWIKAIHVPPV